MHRKSKLVAAQQSKSSSFARQESIEDLVITKQKLSSQVCFFNSAKTIMDIFDQHSLPYMFSSDNLGPKVLVRILL